MSGAPLKAYYYRYPNFGDMLNEQILTDFFHQAWEYAEFSRADLVMLGSLLDKLLDNGKNGKSFQEIQKQADRAHPIHVWGTGMLYPYDGIEQHPVRPLVIHALRGERTREQLAASFRQEISCVLADPGLLAPKIVPAQGKRWDVGIVPHYVDEKEPVFQRMKKVYPNSVIIDVGADPKTVLRQISQCRTVFSTSLHGIITADAYNIPNCWCEVSDRILGNGYKYHDYFSSFGTDREPFDLRQGILPDPDKHCRTSFSSYREVRKKQRELLQCFPYAEQKTGIKKLFSHTPTAGPTKVECL